MLGIEIGKGKSGSGNRYTNELPDQRYYHVVGTCARPCDNCFKAQWSGQNTGKEFIDILEREERSKERREGNRKKQRSPSGVPRHSRKACRKREANKGAWGMPRLSEAKKGAVSCENLWGPANRARSTGARMGKPGPLKAGHTARWADPGN